MKVAFLHFHPVMASARLRGYIPEAALRRLGVKQGRDVLIVSKHSWPDSAVEGFGKIIFDVCDDHFHDMHEAHYRKWVERADLVTCNSQPMADLIWMECQRMATVIPDPYESPERPASVGNPPLWFGHSANWPDVEPLLEVLPNLVCVTNKQHPRATPWSPGAMERAFNRCGIVLIPTGRNQAKSANRAIESIRNGLYPCTGRMPAYDDLGLGTDDVVAEMRQRLGDQDETIERIQFLQSMVEARFNPLAIGRLWKKAVESLC